MTTLEAPTAAITDADLARPLRVFQNRPTLGVPFWRWECRACGDSGGGGSHPDAVGRALTHCVEHPSHPSSLVPPVNCRQDNPRAPLRTIYEWLVARSALEPLDGDPLMPVTRLAADGTVAPGDPDGGAGIAPTDREFAALTSADGEYAGFGPLDGDYAVFASADGEFAGFGPLDGEFAPFPAAGGDPTGLSFLDDGRDGEFAGDGAAVRRRLEAGWSRALPVSWPPNELFEHTGAWDEPPRDWPDPAGDQAVAEELGAWPPLPADSPVRPADGPAITGSLDSGATAEGAEVMAEDVPGGSATAQVTFRGDVATGGALGDGAAAGGELGSAVPPGETHGSGVPGAGTVGEDVPGGGEPGGAADATTEADDRFLRHDDGASPVADLPETEAAEDGPAAGEPVTGPMPPMGDHLPLIAGLPPLEEPADVHGVTGPEVPVEEPAGIHGPAADGGSASSGDQDGVDPMGSDVSPALAGFAVRDSTDLGGPAVPDDLPPAEEPHEEPVDSPVVQDELPGMTTYAH